MSPRNPVLLDLYCGAGGAAMGYHRVGFEVFGVDITYQPHYPFEFHQADALSYLRGRLYVRDTYDGFLGFDAIHASPPCQLYSGLNARWKRDYPDLIEPTRELLEASGLPYVMENVPGSPLKGLLMMCGGGELPVVECADGKHRQVQRHRYFECNFPALGHPCQHPYPALGVYGRGRWSNDDSAHRGGYQGSKDENAAGMDIDWMNREELSQAIPPAYTEHIGRWLLAAVNTPRQEVTPDGAPAT